MAMTQKHSTKHTVMATAVSLNSLKLNQALCLMENKVQKPSAQSRNTLSKKIIVGKTATLKLYYNYAKTHSTNTDKYFTMLYSLTARPGVLKEGTCDCSY